MNKSIKKIILGIILISSLFIITGCGNKKTINLEKFTEVSKEKGYNIVDVTKQYEAYQYIKSGTVASSNNNWQIEFYILEDEAGAKNMYDINKNKFEKEKHDSKTYSEVSMNNYATYSLKTDKQYMYISRIDNTLIYCNVQTKYEKEAKAFIKELGY